MGEQTGISWATHSFNGWIGCERVSPACAHCYADVLASGRMGMPGLWGGAETPRRITAESTWKKPLKWNRDAEREGVRARVFCASMSDAFEDRPDLEEPRERLFGLIDQTRSLDWLLLTKRPEFARDWLRAYYERQDDWGRVWMSRDGLAWGCLPNVWVGVSVENQRWTWRVDVLREIPCAIRFISAEPLLGSLLRTTAASSTGGPYTPSAEQTDVESEGAPARGRSPLDLTGIDWLIVGGESGAKNDARPMHPDWASELRDEAQARSIPFHFKQQGAYAPVLSGGVLSGDICLSEDGDRDIAGPDYVCFANESDGTVMRYAGATPKAGGKLLDGREYCEVPNVGILA